MLNTSERARVPRLPPKTQTTRHIQRSLTSCRQGDDNRPHGDQNVCGVSGYGPMPVMWGHWEDQHAPLRALQGQRASRQVHRLPGPRPCTRLALRNPGPRTLRAPLPWRAAASHRPWRPGPPCRSRGDLRQVRRRTSGDPSRGPSPSRVVGLSGASQGESVDGFASYDAAIAWLRSGRRPRWAGGATGRPELRHRVRRSRADPHERLRRGLPGSGPSRVL
jgi:hypothetical protein